MQFPKTYWRAIHSDRVVDSKTLSDDIKPYNEITRAILEKVVFYKLENGKETTLKEFINPSKDICWRLRNRLTNGQLVARFWVIEEGKSFYIIDGASPVEKHLSAKAAETSPIIRTPLDER